MHIREGYAHFSCVDLKKTTCTTVKCEPCFGGDSEKKKKKKKVALKQSAEDLHYFTSFQKSSKWDFNQHMSN